MLDKDLRGAENMSGRKQRHRDVADAARRTIGERIAASRTGAQPQRHDGECFRRGQHGTVAGARMVGMAVRNYGARHTT